ncbi:sensor domain-containing diguanylate cyclase [Motiliproteus coralliicola]|uniref:diguanylate cyclase n=1 Tax=Motiliproteus coralliicola TaxID=2283196 RepID=A0A369WS23_9GAMM|nr:sensor domain-containing diguanylate cyclase [Motiliproteus coralliicola]RDE24928.1 sensor domain-containing diguanylate cyclase [Motiliproteus coralliicola]
MIDRNSWLLDADELPISLDKWQQNVGLIANLFHAPSVCIFQTNAQGSLVIESNRNESNPYQPGCFVPRDAELFSHVLAELKRELYVPDASADLRWLTHQEVAESGFVSYLGVPLRWPSGQLFGSLCILDRVPTDYRPQYFELLKTFRALIESDLSLMVQSQMLNQMTLTDELTGIYNRQGFRTLAEHKLSVAKRYGHTYGLIYFDLDNLHSINEQLGPDTGDNALQALAQAMSSELRDSDIAARIGSDEFAALVFVRQQEDMENLAIRIQRKLNLIKQQRDSMPPLTTSVGAKCYQANSDTNVDKMLEEVDRMVYNLKQKKRLATVGVDYSSHH